MTTESQIKNTLDLFEEITGEAKSLFLKKAEDYGSSWRILRLPSITDQIFIKAKRIRSIQDSGKQLVDDPIRDEFIGIINYSVMALMQIKLIDEDETDLELSVDELEMRYNMVISDIRVLLVNKNTDYGEAYRDMRIPSIVDIILMKLIRIKQIEKNGGKTQVSEGVDAGYQDLINYGVFALILINSIDEEG